MSCLTILPGSCVLRVVLDLAGGNCHFHIGDGLGDLDFPGASVGAVEDRPALPHAEGVGHYFESIVHTIVP